MVHASRSKTPRLAALLLAVLLLAPAGAAAKPKPRPRCPGAPLTRELRFPKRGGVWDKDSGAEVTSGACTPQRPPTAEDREVAPKLKQVRRKQGGLLASDIGPMGSGRYYDVVLTLIARGARICLRRSLVGTRGLERAWPRPFRRRGGCATSTATTASPSRATSGARSRGSGRC